MSDIRTLFIDFDRGADYALSGIGLEADDGLETAVILSLFTDRRAESDDVAPDGRDDRRGWWADAWPASEGDRIGSRLWLLHREKQLPIVLARAEEYAREALAWLVEDGVAESVAVSASIPRAGILGLDVSITRPRSPTVQYRFDAFLGNA
jgi:phage gp46-like protein